MAHLFFLLVLLLAITGVHANPGTSDHDPAGKPVVKQKVGEGASAAWVFLPPSVPAGPRPVAIFMHGYRALDPYDYGGWIDHLARRGVAVIFPVYEEGRRDNRDQLLENAAAGIRNGLDHIEAQNVEIDMARVAAVGHSLGGGMTILLAAYGEQLDLPALCAIMPVQAGSKGGQGFPTEAFADLTASLKIVAVNGDSDQFADSRLGLRITKEARQVPQTHKRFFILLSDEQATSPLIADHYAPLSPDDNYRLEPRSWWGERRKNFVKKIMSIRDGEVDVLDTRALWPLFDNLLEKACAGTEGLAPVLKSTDVEWQLLQLTEIKP
jgi:dienelactone hydrolase